MPDLTPADLELLSAYLDNELSPGERAAVERRLSADPALRVALEDLHRVAILVRDYLPVPPRPRDFRLDPAVYGRAAPAAGPTLIRAARRVYPPWGRLAALAASLAVIFFAGLLALTALRGGGAPAAQVALAPTGPPSPSRTAAPTAAAAESDQAAGDTNLNGAVGQAMLTATLAPSSPDAGADDGAAASPALNDTLPAEAVTPAGGFVPQTETGGLPTGVPAFPATTLAFAPSSPTPMPALGLQATASPDLSLRVTATALADILGAEITLQAQATRSSTPALQSFAADAANAAPVATGAPADGIVGGAAPPPAPAGTLPGAPPGEAASEGQQRQMTATPKPSSTPPPTAAVVEQEAEAASLAQGAVAAVMTASATPTSTATPMPAPTGTPIALQELAPSAGREEAAQPPSDVVTLAAGIALGVGALLILLAVLRG